MEKRIPKDTTTHQDTPTDTKKETYFDLYKKAGKHMEKAALHSRIASDLAIKAERERLYGMGLRG